VRFKHNDCVRVVAGPYAGLRGSLVTVLQLEPEPRYVLELESGKDVEVIQSELENAPAYNKLDIMQTVLESANAWFFDSASHGLGGSLTIRLVEGIKDTETQLVDIDGTKLGPYFAVRVDSTSRCVDVTFEQVLAFFVYDESYDAADSELKKDSGRFLISAAASSFRKFVEARTSVAHLHQEPYQEFLLCCEDRIFQVLSADAPEVRLLQERPDLSVERTNTWSAS